MTAENTIKSASQITMMLFGAGIGIVIGIVAVLIRYTIGLVHNGLFEAKFGFFFDANVHASINPWGPWIVLAPVVGALGVSWLVKKYALSARGGGVPQVMEAIYFQEGRIPFRVGLIKFLATSISIGSGGSAGREGPIVQIGAALGSWLSKFILLTVRQRVILLAAGAAGGIAATFNTPIGAIVFAIELLLVSVNAASLLPVMTSVCAATYMGRLLTGLAPAFDVPSLTIPGMHLISPLVLLLFIPFGVLIGAGSALLVRAIYWLEDVFGYIENHYLRHMIGMLGVGLLLYAFMYTTGYYYVDGMGYPAVIDILHEALTDPWLLLLLFAAKLLATSLTFGSGASGGIFSPSLFLGATLGAALGVVFVSLFPGLGLRPVAFAIAGMAGVVGGSTGAAMTAIILVLEMTGDSSVALPVILTVGVAYGVRKGLLVESIYTLRLLRRGLTIPEGLQAAIATAQLAQEVMSDVFRVVREEELGSISDIKPREVLIIQDKSDHIVGTLIESQLRAHAQDQWPSLIKKEHLVFTADTELPKLMRQMKRAELSIGLVGCVAHTHLASAIIGVVRREDIVEAYHRSTELL